MNNSEPSCRMQIQTNSSCTMVRSSLSLWDHTGSYQEDYQLRELLEILKPSYLSLAVTHGQSLRLLKFGHLSSQKRTISLSLDVSFHLLQAMEYSTDYRTMISSNVCGRPLKIGQNIRQSTIFAEWQ
jgi:hypothetical protein